MGPPVAAEGRHWGRLNLRGGPEATHPRGQGGFFSFFILAVTEYFENMHRSQGAAPLHGWLLLVRKDGSLSPRFPLVERRYVFGRYAGWRAGELRGWDACRTG